MDKSYTETKADGAKALRNLLTAAAEVLEAEKILREKPRPRQTFLTGSLNEK